MPRLGIFRSHEPAHDLDERTDVPCVDSVRSLRSGGEPAIGRLLPALLDRPRGAFAILGVGYALSDRSCSPMVACGTSRFKERSNATSSRSCPPPMLSASPLRTPARGWYDRAPSGLRALDSGIVVPACSWLDGAPVDSVHLLGEPLVDGGQPYHSRDTCALGRTKDCPRKKRSASDRGRRPST